MRSDLNIVANTQDVIVYDVDKITKRVDNLDVEMSDVKNRVSHLESKVKSLNIKTDIALVLTAASTALSIGNTLELTGKYISIGMGKLRNFINNGYTRLATTSGEASEVELAALDYSENLPPVPFEGTRMTNTDGYVKLKSWIHAAHVKPKFSSLYADDNEESANNPHAMIVSYATLNDVCIYYRDSLKPCFNVVCHQLDNINNTIRDVAYKKDLQGMVKLSDFVDVAINNCTLPEDQSQNILIITFEHPIYCGDLCFTLSFTSNDNQQYSHNLKITFSPYDDPQLTGDEWVEGKGGVDIIDDNQACLTWTTFNINEQSNVVYTITTNDVKYKISERGINDLVYKETTDDLDIRIKALEALKHEPPVIDLNNYPTVDEVNEALSNYVLKSENEQLKAKINELETIITSLTARLDVLDSLIPKPPSLPEFYQGFTYREMDETKDYYHVDNRYSNTVFDIYIEPVVNENNEYDMEYVVVLEDADGFKHYLRIVLAYENDDKTEITYNAYYIDELNGHNEALTIDAAGYVYVPDYLADSFSTASYEEYHYVEKYSKA